MILFPNLGLEFQHIRSGISVLGFEITFFGILLGLSLLLGITIVLAEVYSTDQSMDEYLNLALVVIPVSLVGARIYYVLFQLSRYRNAIWDMFIFRKGGFDFYGALIAGVLVIVLYANFQKISCGRILDTLCIGLAAGQIPCTLGAYFNRECFGEYTNSFLAMQIPLDSVSYCAVTENMRKHIETIDGQQFIQVRPLFVAAFIWSIFVLAVVIFYKGRRKFEGELFLVYLVVYSLGRFCIEGARADALTLPGTGWKVSCVMAGSVILVSALLLIYARTQNAKARMKRVREREARKFAKKNTKNSDKLV